MRVITMHGFGIKVLWVLGILCIGGSSYGQTAPASTYPRPMTTQEAQDYAHVLNMVKPGRPYILNLADPQQMRFTQRALAAADRISTNAPQTYAAVRDTMQRDQKLAATANHSATALAARPLLASTVGGPQDIETISNFGDEGNNVYTATGYSSVLGGTTQTTITTQLIDTQTKTVYASASSTQYAQGTNFQVPVTGKVPSSANLAAVATIVTVVGNNGNTTVVSTAAMVPASTGTMTAPNYCVRTNPSDPNSNCVINGGQTQYQTTSTTLVPSPPPIKVCFSRGSQQSCDYYNSSGRPATSVFYPEAGTASFGTNTIDPSYATAGSYTASIVDPVIGGGCVFSDHQALGTGWSLANASTLQWTLPQLSMTNPTNCLGVSGGRLVNFNFYVEVPLNTGAGKNTGYITFTSAYNPPMPPGYLGIPAIFLEDSCVAAGTLVRLADGSTTVIEKITADNQPQVMTAAGDKRTVLGTAKGVELHPMIRLKTSLGQDLLITRTHPVLSANGLVMARDLKVGDSVKTEKGMAKIVSTAQEKYTGQVYSLRLGWFDEARSDRRTHSANGIFIGDSVSQIQMEQDEVARLKNDRKEVLRRLPDDKWRQEYQNFINQHR